MRITKNDLNNTTAYLIEDERLGDCEDGLPLTGKEVFELFREMKWDRIYDEDQYETGIMNDDELIDEINKYEIYEAMECKCGLWFPIKNYKTDDKCQSCKEEEMYE